MLETLFDAIRFNLKQDFNKTIHISTANSFIRPCFYLEIGKNNNEILCSGYNKNTITFYIRFFATEDKYNQPDKFEIMRTIEQLNKTFYRVIKYNQYYFNIVNKDYTYDGNGDLILEIEVDYMDELYGGVVDNSPILNVVEINKEKISK